MKLTGMKQLSVYQPTALQCMDTPRENACDELGQDQAAWAWGGDDGHSCFCVTAVFVTGTPVSGGWLRRGCWGGARFIGYGLTRPHPLVFARCGRRAGDHARRRRARSRRPAAALAAAQPRVVFHLASQPIVRLSYRGR